MDFGIFCKISPNLGIVWCKKFFKYKQQQTKIVLLNNHTNKKTTIITDKSRIKISVVYNRFKARYIAFRWGLSSCFVHCADIIKSQVRQENTCCQSDVFHCALIVTTNRTNKRRRGIIMSIRRRRDCKNGETRQHKSKFTYKLCITSKAERLYEFVLKNSFCKTSASIFFCKCLRYHNSTAKALDVSQGHFREIPKQFF